MLAKTIFLLATAALLCNVNTSAQPVQLKHVGWFDLKERLPETFQREQFKVRGFVAHDMGLYFLVVKKSSGQESMLRRQRRIVENDSAASRRGQFEQIHTQYQRGRER